MNTQAFVILMLIGLVTGGVGGILGIGGGLILIPALVFFSGFNQHEAIGTSLAVMLPPIGVFAAYNYYKAGHVNIHSALILAAGFMVGSFFTSKYASAIPENILRKVFGSGLLLVSIRMIFGK